MNGLLDDEGFERLFRLPGKRSRQWDRDDFGRRDGIESRRLRLLLGRSGKSFREPGKIIGEVAHILLPAGLSSRAKV